MQDVLSREGWRELSIQGFVRVPILFATPDDAWRCAAALIGADEAIDDAFEVLGNFVVPPPEGPQSRDFQTLHFDFGLPLAPVRPADVACFTALHVPTVVSSTQAFTRLVPLRALLGTRPWPERGELVRRLAAYGDSHGTRDPGRGYFEGSLARIIEAALGQAPVLPNVRTNPEFLCGTEFSTLTEETQFFAQRALPVEAAVIEICLRPGELLVLDNLALAHGRRGTRAPGELNQRVFGHRALPVPKQVELRDRVLGTFSPDEQHPFRR